MRTREARQQIPKHLFGEISRLLYNPAMRLTRLTSTVLFLISVMAVTAGCSTVQTSQSPTSGTLALQQKEDSSSEYVDSVTNTLGGYYDETVSYLTDSCGVGGHTVATGKALLYGIAGGVRGVAETASYGVINAGSVEGVVIAAAVGSGVGLIIGINEAYEGFESDTRHCNVG